jgi:hypothetical protein
VQVAERKKRDEISKADMEQQGDDAADGFVSVMPRICLSCQMLGPESVFGSVNGLVLLHELVEFYRIRPSCQLLRPEKAFCPRQPCSSALYM